MSNAVAPVVSPIAQFITDVVEPQRPRMHVWQETKKHQEILLEDAQKRRRAEALKIGPSYLLRRGGTRIGGVEGRVTTLVSAQAHQASQTSELSHAYLQASQIPTVKGQSFHPSLADAAESYRLELASAAIVRPAAALARPITTLAVTSKSGMHREWDRAASALTHLRSANQLIQVERFSTDLPLRLFVVGEEVVAALARVPLYLLGDGSSSAMELVEKERARRSECLYLNRRFLTIGEEHFATLGLTPDEVLPEGELRVLASSPGGAPGGGLSIDVLEDLGEDLKSLAIDAMWAFPGLSATAVDIMTPTLDSSEGAVVSDVVPSADVSEFIYPAHGEPRRCGKMMIDHMILGR